MRYITLSTLFTLICLGSLAQQDSADCYSRFFARTHHPFNNSYTLLVAKNGKVTSLHTYLSKFNKEGLSFAQDGLIDLDKDGKEELVVYTFTGGAHCCDEMRFYSKSTGNRYALMASTFGGEICATDSNEFTYSFYEHYGYFFTCYACAYEDSTDEAPVPVHSILLKYVKGKLRVQPGDQDLRATINDNLGKLGERPYQPLPDNTSFDDGLRKEIALNLVVYYYSFGKNLPETEKLFRKYYKHPDAGKVWSAFVETLGWIKKSNDF